MIGLLLVMVLGAWAIYYRQNPGSAPDIPQKLSEKLDKLWFIAQEALADRKYLRAEKALLMILRVDERNATAYNRLGIIYAKQKAFADAIECFEIAQSLEPSASSLHNVGLIYFETEAYDKAALAFEQALSIEEDVATRHIAYAKVQEKLGDTKKMLTALERAVELEPVPQALKILADAYERSGRPEDAVPLREKAGRMLAHKVPTRKLVQKRRVVM